MAAVIGSQNSMMEPGTISQEGKLELKKQINLFHCVSIIVGIIIGAGIFVSPVGITIHVRSVGKFELCPFLSLFLFVYIFRKFCVHMTEFD